MFSLVLEIEVSYYQVLIGDNRLVPFSQGKSYNPFSTDKELGTIPSLDVKIVSFYS